MKNAIYKIFKIYLLEQVPISDVNQHNLSDNIYLKIKIKIL